MFTATSFIYDGIPSEEFNVMIYSFDDSDIVEDELWTNSIVEDRLNTRYDPIFYGININKQLTFELTIGSTEYMTRNEVERVAHWLTSHETYKWLEICQDDMQDFRYNAMFTEVKTAHINGLPVAFKCTVVTDSQFAYEYPIEYSFKIKDGKVMKKLSDGTTGLYESAHIFNKSTYNGYIYPMMTIEIADGCEKFSIINTSDKNRAFILTEFPNNTSSIADVFRGLQGKLLEEYDKIEFYISQKNNMLSFINEFKGYPNSNTGHAITNSVVDSYLRKSKASLTTELRSLEKSLLEQNYYGLFIPTGNSGMTVSGSQRFRVLENFDSKDYVDFAINLDWLKQLKSANNDYKYNNYNLVAIYNYYAALEVGHTTNLKIYEIASKINLIKSIIDYLDILENLKKAEDASKFYYDEIESYSVSGDAYVDGDELVVFVDNKNQIMTCNRDNINIYEYFGDDYGNHHFLRLVQGDNTLAFQGTGTVTITCEYLRKVGV